MRLAAVAGKDRLGGADMTEYEPPLVESYDEEEFYTDEVKALCSDF